MLETIEEQERLWGVEANASIAFDVMDENGANKCTFRDLAVWIRRNYTHLHHMPVLLHAFEETAAESMTADTCVLQIFPQCNLVTLWAASCPDSNFPRFCVRYSTRRARGCCLTA